jgi:hypothetical protein
MLELSLKKKETVKSNGLVIGGGGKEQQHDFIDTSRKGKAALTRKNFFFVFVFPV